MGSQIGFIGVGQMGAPMAERLLAAGRKVVVFDVNAAAMQPLVARGAVAAGSAQAAAAGAETVFACLPSPEVSRSVALGPDGLGGVGGFHTYVETSTIGTAAMKAIASGLAARGIAVLDAPVSGGPRGARAGKLATMVAGDRAAFERVKPLFDAIAAKVFYVGAAPGLAQITKLANNMISAAGMAAAMEAAVMAVKAGVDAHTLIDVVNASTGRNTATTDKFPQSILPRTFDYGGKLATMYKDVELCFAEARALGVPMWVGAAVVQLWFQAMTEGRGQDDYTTLIRTIEGWTGVTVGGEDPGRQSEAKR
jgi:3-hydroxyisobutyrate dehydrogenase-like beta-hydroxyacid dehydrogenase